MVETKKKTVYKTESGSFTIEGGNDWTLVAKKFVYGLIFAFIGLIIPYAVNFLQTEDLSSLPPWFLSFVPVIVAILLAAQNAWAHRLRVTKVDE